MNTRKEKLGEVFGKSYVNQLINNKLAKVLKNQRFTIKTMAKIYYFAT